MVAARHHNPAYDDPRWRRLRDRKIRAHKRTNGYLCPGYDTPPHLTDRLSGDHVVPLVEGGAMFDEGNVQVLCVGCNARKDAGKRRR